MAWIRAVGGLVDGGCYDPSSSLRRSVGIGKMLFSKLDDSPIFRKQYVEKLFVRKQCPRQYIISITQQMWHCVHLNDKKAVYRLIVCSDADANCTNGHPSFSTSLTLAEVMLLHECSKSTLHRSMSCMSADSAYKLSTRSTFSSSSSTSDEQKEVDECLDGCSLLHVACHTADASMIDSFTVWG